MPKYNEIIPQPVMPQAISSRQDRSLLPSLEPPCEPEFCFSVELGDGDGFGVNVFWYPNIVVENAEEGIVGVLGGSRYLGDGSLIHIDEPGT